MNRERRKSEKGERRKREQREEKEREDSFTGWDIWYLVVPFTDLRTQKRGGTESGGGQYYGMGHTEFELPVLVFNSYLDICLMLRNEGQVRIYLFYCVQKILWSLPNQSKK